LCSLDSWLMNEIVITKCQNECCFPTLQQCSCSFLLLFSIFVSSKILFLTPFPFKCSFYSLVLSLCSTQQVYFTWSLWYSTKYWLELTLWSCSQCFYCLCRGWMALHLPSIVVGFRVPLAASMLILQWIANSWALFSE
jgi:hypothetical protein